MTNATRATTASRRRYVSSSFGIKLQLRNNLIRWSTIFSTTPHQIGICCGTRISTFYPGWCSTPTLLLICSSFSRENGHSLLICSSLSTAQYHIFGVSFYSFHKNFNISPAGMFESMIFFCVPSRGRWDRFFSLIVFFFHPI